MSTTDSPLIAAAAEEDPSAVQGIADTIDGWFESINAVLGAVIFAEVPIGGTDAYVVVLWSIFAAIAFSVYFGFVQLRTAPVSLETVRGKWTTDKDPGEVTHFQALTSATAATVGLGNIAGVAAAVSMGGPGATFWMILAGIFGMCTKFVECTLGVKYRYIDEDGVVHGGPFQYLKVAFAKLGRIPVAIITGIFAVAIILFGVVGGGMFQSNQAYSQLRAATGGEDGFFGNEIVALIFGIVFASLVGVVIIGGIKSIGNVTAKLVPAMAAVYVAACLVVIGANFSQIPSAVGAIFEGAFSPEGIQGGVLGVIIIGVMRAAFSNEAGIGSAPIAHSAVKTRRPVSEGFTAILEPFIDTVVVCTMTALVIIFAWPPEYDEALAAGEGDVALTSAAFNTFIPGFDVILTVAVLLFAFSTVITWSYYGIQAWRHLFGKSQLSDTLFRVFVLVLIVTGCLVTVGNIFEIADSALFACIFINVIGCAILAPRVKEEMKQYLADRKAGRLLEDPEPLPHQIKEQQKADAER